MTETERGALLALVERLPALALHTQVTWQDAEPDSETSPHDSDDST